MPGKHVPNEWHLIRPCRARAVKPERCGVCRGQTSPPASPRRTSLRTPGSGQMPARRQRRGGAATGPGLRPERRPFSAGHSQSARCAGISARRSGALEAETQPAPMRSWAARGIGGCVVSVQTRGASRVAGAASRGLRAGGSARGTHGRQRDLGGRGGLRPPQGALHRRGSGLQGGFSQYQDLAVRGLCLKARSYS